MLSFWNAPPIVVQLCAAVLTHFNVADLPKHDAYELFAGRKAVTEAFVSLNFAAVAVELLDSKALDLASDQGFSTSLLLHSTP